jgi:transposase
MLLIGYFKGFDSERDITWCCIGSLSLRRLLGCELNKGTPDHSSMSRTRRLIGLKTRWFALRRRGIINLGRA